MTYTGGWARFVQFIAWVFSRCSNKGVAETFRSAFIFLFWPYCLLVFFYFYSFSYGALAGHHARDKA